AAPPLHTLPLHAALPISSLARRRGVSGKNLSAPPLLPPPRLRDRCRRPSTFDPRGRPLELSYRSSLPGIPPQALARDHRQEGPRSEEHTSELQSRGHLAC